MPLFRLFYALVLIVASDFAFAHGGENRVEIELNSSSTISAGATVVSFQLIDNKLNQLVTPAELNVDNQKQLHFIAYDPALKEFQHVHPQFDGTFWNVDMDYSVDGSYFVWAQGQLTDGSEDFSTFVRIDVSGGKPAWPDPVLGDVRSAESNGSVATLSNDTLKAGQMAMLGPQGPSLPIVLSQSETHTFRFDLFKRVCHKVTLSVVLVGKEASRNLEG